MTTISRRALAAELRGTIVTANAVSPGSIATPILDESARLYGLESAEAFSVRQPLARLIQPEEVAATVAWIVGPYTHAVSSERGQADRSQRPARARAPRPCSARLAPPPAGED